MAAIRGTTEYSEYTESERDFTEIKAVSALTDEHCAQLMNYLRAIGLKVGLLRFSLSVCSVVTDGCH